MECASRSTPLTWRHSQAQPLGDVPALSTIVYRSRAVRSLSPTDLHTLTTNSQARNGRESITGLMVYDDGRFFQWLEGPADGVERVMGSIRSDPRHADIEVLKNQTAKTRIFGEWSMKLATQEPDTAEWRNGVIPAPREIVENLRQRPEAAPDLLVELVAASAAAIADSAVSDALTQMPLEHRTAAILKRVMLSNVIPRLVQKTVGRATQAPVLLASPRAAELADLLIGVDQGAAIELIRELYKGGAVAPLFATIFEPAARRLGDMWTEDWCSEFDVTLGLMRLQSAARLLSSETRRAPRLAVARPVVLIAPAPGELHRVGATMDNAVLETAGWLPQCEYPADDQALQDLLADSWFDVLDLSLSTAFRREDSLPRMAETIADARQASRNPALIVLVGGRAFVEDKTAGVQVGADLATTSSLNVDRAILNTMSATQTATTLALMQVTATPS
jgi:hypothetical protein